MAKLFSWLKPTGNPPVNGYDLSKRETFSFVPGMLNLSYQRLLMPKTHVSLKLGAIINSMPMVNQNFSRGQFVTDVYQVPLQQLWSDFNDFYAQAKETMSSADIHELISDCANVGYLNLLQFVVCDLFMFAGYAQQTGDTASETFARFLSNMDSYVTDESMVDPPLLGLDVHGIPVCFGAVRLLDMAGYGNLLVLIRSWLDTLSESTFVRSSTFFNLDIAVSSCYFVYDMVFRPMYDLPTLQETFSDMSLSINAEQFFFNASYQELLPDLRLNPTEYPKSVNFPDNLPYVSVWPLLAYQKVFADIYRNTFYDESDVYSFNFDMLFKNRQTLEMPLFGDSPDVLKFIQGILSVRYRQFKNDMFTCLLPNSQMGEVAMVSVGDSAYSLATSVTDAQNDDPVVINDGKATVRGANDTWKLSPTPAFSVLVQRRAEALQRYKERYLRAGNRLKDQFISTFGKVPYYLEDKYVRYLGTLSGQLGLQGVPATNDTGDYNVGERAAYGVGSIQDQLDFACDDFSMLIAITYYIPELDYESFALDPAHTASEPFDFPVPEFENIGLQPLYRNSLSFAPTMLFDESERSIVEVLGNRVIGYGPAYLNWKTDVDRLHGEFGSFTNINGHKISGIFASWVTSRGNVSMTELGDYYIRPDFLNSLMVAQYHGWSGQDPFVAVFNWDIKISQPLSVVGLPIWN